MKYFKDTLQLDYNEKFNFLEQKEQINADFLGYLQDGRKNFLSSLQISRKITKSKSFVVPNFWTI